jgi:hypothetical protein
VRFETTVTVRLSPRERTLLGVLGERWRVSMGGAVRRLIEEETERERARRGEPYRDLGSRAAGG